MFAVYVKKTTRMVKGSVFGRGLSTLPIGSPLTRFETIPETLYRIHNSGNIKLRSFERRIAAGMQGEFSYDLHEKDGMVWPVTEDVFTEPNGMSLRPKCDLQRQQVMNHGGSKLKIFVLPAGMEVPSKLILVHEHTDHYSMQVRIPMTFEEFNKELNLMLKGLKTLSKDEFLQMFGDSEASSLVDEEDDEETEAFDN